MLAIFLEARRFRFKIEFLIDTKVGSYDQNGKGTRNFFLLEHLERGDSPFVTALRWRARKDEVKTLKENRFLISLGASAVGFSSPLFFFLSPCLYLFLFSWAKSMEMRAMFSVPPRVQCPSRARISMSVMLIAVWSDMLMTDAEDILLHAIHWFHLLGIACPRSNSSLR